MSLLVSACGTLAPFPASATPASQAIASQVAQRLTQTASVASTSTPLSAATSSPAPTAARRPATATESQTPTITPSPTETGTVTPAPRPTVQLSSLPLPPATFGGESHFFFGSPIGGGQGAFIASAYRYGATGPGQRFAPHHGVDYSAGAGTPLVAVAPGTIYYAGSDLERSFGPQPDFYGNLVMLQLAQSWNGHTVFALYGHMDQVSVAPGQAVNAGDVLGTVGATGVALGPHPHLEVRLDFPESYWDTRNPELWLAPAGGFGTLAVRVTNALGQYLPGVRVDFTCADGARRFMETYWYSGVNPDDAYGENAGMTNIPPGYCDFQAQMPGEIVRVEDQFVNAGQVTFVWIRP